MDPTSAPTGARSAAAAAAAISQRMHLTGGHTAEAAAAIDAAVARRGAARERERARHLRAALAVGGAAGVAAALALEAGDDGGYRSADDGAGVSPRARLALSVRGYAATRVDDDGAAAAADAALLQPWEPQVTGADRAAGSPRHGDGQAGGGGDDGDVVTLTLGGRPSGGPLPFPEGASGAPLSMIAPRPPPLLLDRFDARRLLARWPTATATTAEPPIERDAAAVAAALSRERWRDLPGHELYEAGNQRARAVASDDAGERGRGGSDGGDGGSDWEDEGDGEGDGGGDEAGVKGADSNGSRAAGEADAKARALSVRVPFAVAPLPPSVALPPSALSYRLLAATARKLAESPHLRPLLLARASQGSGGSGGDTRLAFLHPRHPMHAAFCALLRRAADWPGADWPEPLEGGRAVVAPPPPPPPPRVLTPSSLPTGMRSPRPASSLLGVDYASDDEAVESGVEETGSAGGDGGIGSVRSAALPTTAAALPPASARPPSPPAPPAEVVSVVDSVCAYARRSGPGFLSLIQQRQRDSPAFAFLQPWSPHHEYYQRRVAAALRELAAERVARIVAAAAGAASATAPTAAAVVDVAPAAGSGGELTTHSLVDAPIDGGGGGGWTDVAEDEAAARTAAVTPAEPPVAAAASGGGGDSGEAVSGGEAAGLSEAAVVPKIRAEPRDDAVQPPPHKRARRALDADAGRVAVAATASAGGRREFISVWGEAETRAAGGLSRAFAGAAASGATGCGGGGGGGGEDADAEADADDLIDSAQGLQG